MVTPEQSSSTTVTTSTKPAVRESELRAIDPALAQFGAVLRRLPTRQGGFERIFRRVMVAWCWVVGWRIDIGPAADLPARKPGVPGSGCLVACAPHRAWVEPFLLLAAWPPDAARLVWLADGRTVTSSWWRRRLLPRLGVIPIGGSVSGPRAYAELASEILAAGAALAVFPEHGPPSAPDRTRPISPGFAYLTRRAGAPVIPLVIGGTHAIGRGSMFCGRFLEPFEVGPPDRGALGRGGRPLAHALADRVADAINAQLPELNAMSEARRPARQRWRWLATLFQ